MLTNGPAETSGRLLAWVVVGRSLICRRPQFHVCVTGWKGFAANILLPDTTRLFIRAQALVSQSPSAGTQSINITLRNSGRSVLADWI